MCVSVFFKILHFVNTSLSKLRIFSLFLKTLMFHLLHYLLFLTFFLLQCSDLTNFIYSCVSSELNLVFVMFKGESFDLSSCMKSEFMTKFLRNVGVIFLM